MSWNDVKRKAGLYWRLTRMHKPIGTLLLLWPTLWALWIAAGGAPQWHLVLIFSVGTLLMRSAGCVMNDIADRDFDPHVKRTRERPLATREVSVCEALVLVVVLCLAAFALVFGEDELAQGQVAVKPLRNAGATQYLRSLVSVDDWAAELRNA